MSNRFQSNPHEPELSMLWVIGGLSTSVNVMDHADEELAALIDLHCGLARLGPGDDAFSRRILSLLPPLVGNPRITDLGCGAGAGALVLAQWYQAPVAAVDTCRSFLEQLDQRAKARSLAHLIRTVQADMGHLDWPLASLDLLWSEGAAYHLTFAGALRTWRPLLATGGVAVISELSLFASVLPAAVKEFWDAAYPTAGTEEENAQRAPVAGFEVLGIHRLPSPLWWSNYYDPLARNIEQHRPHATPAMLKVIEETEAELELFRRHSDVYGYSFYLLRAV